MTSIVTAATSLGWATFWGAGGGGFDVWGLGKNDEGRWVVSIALLERRIESGSGDDVL